MSNDGRLLSLACYISTGSLMMDLYAAGFEGKVLLEAYRTRNMTSLSHRVSPDGKSLES